MQLRRMRDTLPAIAVLLLLISGCVGLPRHVVKIHSEALPDPESTSLGRVVAAEEGAKNLSGIRLLTSGEEALADLIALADHAERTLDIQYYIIHQDDSARLLLHHLRLAADRGVRVRVLVDDLNTAGEDRRFMHLGQHANVEVRVFNPFPGGRSKIWTRLLASVNDIPRINHRMHNKLFVADNALAVTGGRNIGDQYFTRDEHSNFIDLDVVAAGAIVPELSASFDAFWNSKYAYPIASVAAPVSAEPVPPRPSESSAAASANWLEHELESGSVHLTWVPATVLADRPAKIASDASSGEEVNIANNIAALMRSAKQELIVISAYFVPGKDGVAMMRDLVSQGVHIRILTNSLASTDSPLVHTGYSRYRAALLKLGVELSEVRPKLGQKRARFHPFRGSSASLHAKALVIDQKMVFIGSLNMDARSARTNSELGLVIRSADIAHQVTNLLDDISADGSYKLRLVDHTNRIEWTSGEPGSEKTWYNDPETTRMQRFTLKILGPFAHEELL
ncbi:MAG TPA: phospholipase D family protein [Steroidobacteraceae bacterium]|jgi:putative cardiolipin synthase|nr:phospholipase D family protein [Steroidobacteraceae bacterium]